MTDTGKNKGVLDLTSDLTDEDFPSEESSSRVWKMEDLDDDEQDEEHDGEARAVSEDQSDDLAENSPVKYGASDDSLDFTVSEEDEEIEFFTVEAPREKPAKKAKKSKKGKNVKNVKNAKHVKNVSEVKNLEDPQVISSLGGPDEHGESSKDIHENDPKKSVKAATQKTFEPDLEDSASSKDDASIMRKGAKRFSGEEQVRASDVNESYVGGITEDMAEVDLFSEERSTKTEGLSSEMDSSAPSPKLTWENEEASDISDSAFDQPSSSELMEKFEADLLLVEAHKEIDAVIAEKRSSGEVLELEPVEASILDGDPAAIKGPEGHGLFDEAEKTELLEGPESDGSDSVVFTENASEGPLNSRSGTLSLKSEIEAILFASPKPLKIGEILEVHGEESSSKEISEAVSALIDEYAERRGGFKLIAAKGGYQFQTDPDASKFMQRMFSSRPRPISRAAQETLAIIAYRQPVTRADIEFVRGVDAGSIVKNLLDRGLIKAVGRKEDAGRPILFGTTDEFLAIYGLESLADLPPLESFQPSTDLVNAGLDLIETQDEVVHKGDFVGSVDDQEEADEDQLELEEQVELEGLDGGDGAFSELSPRGADGVAFEDSDLRQGAVFAEESATSEPEDKTQDGSAHAYGGDPSHIEEGSESMDTVVKDSDALH